MGFYLFLIFSVSYLLFGNTVSVIIICLIIFVSIVFLLIGGKVILSNIGAKKITKGDKINNIVKNVNSKIGRKNVNVYVAPSLSCNIYYIWSLFGSSIVLGKDILEVLSDDEIEALVSITLLQLHRLEGLRKMIILSAILFPYVILAYLTSLKSKFLYPISLLSLSFYIPILYLQKSLFRAVDNEKLLVPGKFNKSNQIKRNLASSRFKLSKKDHFYSYNIFILLLENLSDIDNYWDNRIIHRFLRENSICSRNVDNII